MKKHTKKLMSKNNDYATSNLLDFALQSITD